MEPIKRQDGQSEHLLDYLTRQSGCGFLSNLKYPEKADRRVLAALVEALSPEDAGLKEWNDTLYYLFGSPLELTPELAREGLLARLKEHF